MSLFRKETHNYSFEIKRKVESEYLLIKNKKENSELIGIKEGNKYLMYINSLLSVSELRD